MFLAHWLQAACADFATAAALTVALTISVAQAMAVVASAVQGRDLCFTMLAQLLLWLS